jgi:hypothetical protein
MEIVKSTYYVTTDGKSWDDSKEAGIWQDEIDLQEAYLKQVEPWRAVRRFLPVYGEDLKLNATEWKQKRGNIPFKTIFKEIFVNNYSTARDIITAYSKEI